MRVLPPVFVFAIGLWPHHATARGGHERHELPHCHLEPAQRQTTARQRHHLRARFTVSKRNTGLQPQCDAAPCIRRPWGGRVCRPRIPAHRRFEPHIERERSGLAAQKGHRFYSVRAGEQHTIDASISPVAPIVILFQEPGFAPQGEPSVDARGSQVESHPRIPLQLETEVARVLPVEVVVGTAPAIPRTLLGVGLERQHTEIFRTTDCRARVPTRLRFKPHIERERSGLAAQQRRRFYGVRAGEEEHTIDASVGAVPTIVILFQEPGFAPQGEPSVDARGSQVESHPRIPLQLETEVARVLPPEIVVGTATTVPRTLPSAAP